MSKSMTFHPLAPSSRPFTLPSLVCFSFPFALQLLLAVLQVGPWASVPRPLALVGRIQDRKSKARFVVPDLPQIWDLGKVLLALVPQCPQTLDGDSSAST